MSNTTGNYNTAVGYDAMKATAGNDNAEVALGYQALENDNAEGQGTGSGDGENTAIGYQALRLDTLGAGNTAIGYQSLHGNTNGNNNTAIGDSALLSNPSGYDNVAIGLGAFQTASQGYQNTAVGTYTFQNTTAGNNNIGIGYNAGQNLGIGSDNIYIGNAGTALDHDVIRIGDVQTLTYIAGTIQHLVCTSVTITGGADLAEPFSNLYTRIRKVTEGAVVVIDEENPGHLKLSDQPYDTRVAGVVSGANGINPGIQMHQQGLLEGGKNVALTGRVYVQADASNGAIKPGDLLTTSSTPGHAMKVTDHARAPGRDPGQGHDRLERRQRHGAGAGHPCNNSKRSGILL